MVKNYRKYKLTGMISQKVNRCQGFLARNERKRNEELRYRGKCDLHKKQGRVVRCFPAHLSRCVMVGRCWLDKGKVQRCSPAASFPHCGYEVSRSDCGAFPLSSDRRRWRGDLLARIIRQGELRCFPAQRADGVEARQGLCCGAFPLSTTRPGG